MEIAVAADSPLGQYLAELDSANANAGSSAADLLLPPRSHKASRKGPHPQAHHTNGSCGHAARPNAGVMDYTPKRIFAALYDSVDCFAAQHIVVPKLLSWRPTLRDELQQTAIASGFILHPMATRQHKHWQFGLLLHAIPNAPVLWLSAVVAVVAVGLSAALLDQLHVCGSVLAVLGALAAVSLELSLRALLVWYSHRASRLLRALIALATAMERLDTSFSNSLALVKRAELASRGYRLGSGLLPPIGRLEALDDAKMAPDGEQEAAVAITKRRLRCVALRRRLRALNDLLQTQVSVLTGKKEGDEGGEGEDALGEAFFGIEDGDDSASSSQVPSLLLTALEKQHARSVLLLESAVANLLLRDLARLCSTHTTRSIDTVNLFSRLKTRRCDLEKLTRTLAAWTLGLEAWNASNDPVALLTRTSGGPRSEEKRPTEREYEGADRQLKAVAVPLRELRTVSETLTSLVIVSQHELLVVDNAQAAVESLDSSRAAMGALVQQLQEAWGNYETALSAISTGGSGGEQLQAAGTEEEAQEDPETVSQPSFTSPPVHDNDCTVVFTGTSTGDQDFDLQTLLDQKETGAAGSTPTPVFVHELRDVLAHREATAVRGRTRQVDHDPPASAPEPVANALPPATTDFALPRGPLRRRPRRGAPAVSMDPIRSVTSDPPRQLGGEFANAFSQELQLLLQRSRASQQEKDILESQDDQKEQVMGEA